MNIVYATDNNFVPVMGISVTSLLENNKDVTIYVMSENVSLENQKKLTDFVTGYGQEIIFIPVNLNNFSEVKFDVLTWSKAAFNRIFIGTILEPYSLERVLYLDCDIIVNHDITDLWNFDLNGNAIGMALDPVSKGHKKNVGLSVNSSYYNSGVMLIDINCWKKFNCEESLQRFAIERNGKTPYVDQGLINGALIECIKAIPAKFNVFTIYTDYTYEELLKYRRPSGYFYSKEEIQSAVNDPYIIHYTKSIFTARPWIKNSNHKKKSQWEYYQVISPWKDYMLNIKTVKGIKKVYVFISRFLPRSLNITIQSILHTKIKPLVDRT